VVSELELAGVAELSVVADLTVMVLFSLLLPDPGRGSSMGLVLPGKRRAIDYPGGNVRKIVRNFAEDALRNGIVAVRRTRRSQPP
jgi:hypothetical protein